MDLSKLRSARDRVSRVKGILDVNRYWQITAFAVGIGFRVLPFLIAAVVGGLFLTFATGYGIDLTQDSNFYLKTATSMHYDGDFNTQVTVWPPLYPFLIHLFLFITPWPAAAASLASGVFCLSFLLVMALLLQRSLAHSFVASFMMLGLVSLTGFWEVFGFVWSENAFGCFVALHLLFVCLHHERRALLFLLLAGLFAAFAAMTKYAGAIIILTFSFYVLHSAARETGWRRRAVAASSLILAAVPSLLWAIRNRGIDGSFTGIRKPSGSTFIGNFDALIKVIEHDIPKVFLFLFLFFFVFYLFRLYRFFAEAARREGEGVAFESYLYVFLGIYFISLVYAATTANINRISSRFLSPVYFVFFVAAAQGVRRILDIERLATYRSFVALMVSVCLAFGAASNLKGLTTHFRTLARADRNQDAHLTFGFEKTKLAARLAGYLDDIFEKRRAILVTGVYNMAYQRHHNMYGLFMRQTLFGEGATDVHFHNIVPKNVSDSRRYLYQKSEVSLTYRKDGRERRIDFRNLARQNNFTQIFRSIDDLLRRNDKREIFFVYVRPVRRRPKFNFVQALKTQPLPSGLKVAGTRRMANMTIYRIVKK